MKHCESNREPDDGDARRDAIDHWAQVRNEHESTLEFLAWLERTYRVQLDWDYADAGTPLDVTRLLDEFHGVDRVRLDQQHRAAADRFRRQVEEGESE